jgi:hypothetical protein
LVEKSLKLHPCWVLLSEKANILSRVSPDQGNVIFVLSIFVFFLPSHIIFPSCDIFIFIFFILPSSEVLCL